MKLHFWSKENTQLKNLLTNPQIFFVSSVGPSLALCFWIILIINSMQFITNILDGDRTGIIVNGITLLGFAILICAYLFFGKRSQAIVGQEGIIYTTTQYTVYTPWHNIQHVVPSPHNGQPCLQLQQHAEPISIEQGIHSQTPAVANTLSPTRPVTITGRYDPYNYIPLEPQPILYQSPLWKAIIQNAPHIKGTSASTQEKPTADTP